MSIAHPDRGKAGVLIGIEDIEDDEDAQAATALLDAFAEPVRTEGLEAAWAPILELFPPVITSTVREAIPRVDERVGRGAQR
ncbi:hypothetical protein [Nocardia sp. NPDC049149]|uniref:hypothetical protein n=1 Tax=Nocardia sp. NPDC049149 TaxID=3364315 RepID=UPI00371A2025